MSVAKHSTSERVDIAIGVVERDGKYLIGLRCEGGPLAGYWEFPGGKVSAGETPEDAACRECLEETGLEVQLTGSYPPADHDYPHCRVRLHFFACAPLAERSQLPSRFRWVSGDELRNYQFPPANRELLDMLIAGKSA